MPKGKLAAAAARCDVVEVAAEALLLGFCQRLPCKPYRREPQQQPLHKQNMTALRAARREEVEPKRAVGPGMHAHNVSVQRQFLLDGSQRHLPCTLKRPFTYLSMRFGPQGPKPLMTLPGVSPAIQALAASLSTE